VRNSARSNESACVTGAGVGAHHHPGATDGGLSTSKYDQSHSNIALTGLSNLSAHTAPDIRK